MAKSLSYWIRVILLWIAIFFFSIFIWQLFGAFGGAITVIVYTMWGNTDPESNRVFNDLWED